MTNLQLTFYSVLKTVNFSCIIRKKDNDAHSLHFYLTCTVLNSLATTSQRKRDQSHPNQKGRCKAVTICSWCDIIYGKPECMHVVCSAVSNSLQLHQIVVCQSPLSMEFSRQRILQQVAISSSKRSSRPRDQIHIACMGRRVKVSTKKSLELINEFSKVAGYNIIELCCFSIHQ